jgi:class 3 adenylate cyclase
MSEKAMTEHQDSEQLKQAIAALEAQRALLGDVIVETSIAALRKQLTELETQQTAEQTRKQVTVLFADLSGFTAMSDALDAEDVNEVMNALWVQLDKVIIDHGGTIDKHMGDAVMALWGAESAREDDPERAIRAALAMQKEVTDFGLRFSELVTKLKRQDNLAPKIGMRIGINTGPVLLGDVGTTGEFSALGDTVNIASRLEQAAPISEILIAHDTYRHVRGVFEVAAQEPLKIKGKADTVQTYIIQRAKPRIFRIATRGIEGIKTRFIGRDAELEQLQDIFKETQAHQTARMITVSGEAGIGKSRLLHEFNLRLGLTPDNVWLFQGRASPPMRHTPFALLRDLFATHFQIQDSDSASIAHEKLAQGIREYVGADKEEYAHFIGHLLGLDFSKSPYLRGILSDAQQIRNRAFYYLTQFISAVHARDGNPIVAQLDDIHWADSGSLDAIDHIVKECHTIPLFIICLARPVLFETQPSWYRKEDYHTRIDLQPLSQ